MIKEDYYFSDDEIFDKLELEKEEERENEENNNNVKETFIENNEKHDKGRRNTLHTTTHYKIFLYA